jgi:hypothetical protein
MSKQKSGLKLLIAGGVLVAIVLLLPTPQSRQQAKSQSGAEQSVDAVAELASMPDLFRDPFSHRKIADVKSGQAESASPTPTNAGAVASRRSSGGTSLPPFNPLPSALPGDINAVPDGTGPSKDSGSSSQEITVEPTILIQVRAVIRIEEPVAVISIDGREYELGIGESAAGIRLAGITEAGVRLKTSAGMVTMRAGEERRI